MLLNEEPQGRLGVLRIPPAGRPAQTFGVACRAAGRGRQSLVLQQQQIVNNINLRELGPPNPV